MADAVEQPHVRQADARLGGEQFEALDLGRLDELGARAGAGDEGGHHDVARPDRRGDDRPVALGAPRGDGRVERVDVGDDHRLAARPGQAGQAVVERMAGAVVMDAALVGDEPHARGLVERAQLDALEAQADGGVDHRRQQLVGVEGGELAAGGGDQAKQLGPPLRLGPGPAVLLADPARVAGEVRRREGDDQHHADGIGEAVHRRAAEVVVVGGPELPGDVEGAGAAPRDEGAGDLPAHGRLDDRDQQQRPHRRGLVEAEQPGDGQDGGGVDQEFGERGGAAPGGDVEDGEGAHDQDARGGLVEGDGDAVGRGVDDELEQGEGGADPAGLAQQPADVVGQRWGRRGDGGRGRGGGPVRRGGGGGGGGGRCCVGRCCVGWGVGGGRRRGEGDGGPALLADVDQDRGEGLERGLLDVGVGAEGDGLVGHLAGAEARQHDDRACWARPRAGAGWQRGRP